jgi:hypothetical protein
MPCILALSLDASEKRHRQSSTLTLEDGFLPLGRARKIIMMLSSIPIGSTKERIITNSRSKVNSGYIFGDEWGECVEMLTVPYIIGDGDGL